MRKRIGNIILFGGHFANERVVIGQLGLETFGTHRDALVLWWLICTRVVYQEVSSGK